MKVFEPTHIIIHHTASADDPISMEYDNIRDYHKRIRKWRHIGYHFLIESIEGGSVCIVGRTLGQVGAHAKGWNTHAIGVAVVGNYEENPLPRHKLEHLVEVVSGLAVAFDIPTENIMRHSDVADTLCPGKNFPWNEFVTLVDEYRIGMRLD